MNISTHSAPKFGMWAFRGLNPKELTAAKEAISHFAKTLKVKGCPRIEYASEDTLVGRPATSAIVLLGKEEVGLYNRVKEEWKAFVQSGKTARDLNSGTGSLDLITFLSMVAVAQSKRSQPPASTVKKYADAKTLNIETGGFLRLAEKNALLRKWPAFKPTPPDRLLKVVD